MNCGNSDCAMNTAGICRRCGIGVTFGMPTLAVPTAEGITDAVEALRRGMEAGKWFLIAPDGRLWDGELMKMLAVVAAEMRGEGQRFGQN